MIIEALDLSYQNLTELPKKGSITFCVGNLC